MKSTKHIVNKIHLSTMHKKKWLATKFVKNTIPILKIMLKLNIIRYVKYINKIVIIFTNPNSKLKLKPMSKKIKQYIKYKELEKISKKKKWLCILSTNKGLITSKDCIKYKIGGFLLYNVILNI